MWGRALLVRHEGAAAAAGDSPQQPTVSVASLPQRPPDEGEVLVKVQANTLTPTDVLLCSEMQLPFSDLITVPSAAFVPGHYFFGEVLTIGPFVEGLSIGEAVFGVLDSPTVLRPPPTDVSLAKASGAAVAGEASSDEGGGGGCYREIACVQYSSLIPAAALLAAGCHMPSVVAHLPPMVDALFCVASRLRLSDGEALLIIAPTLSDVVFLLQRLLLIADAWAGPLYLVLLRGSAPTQSDLDRHPLLRPLLSPAKAAGLGAESEQLPGFLGSFMSLSVEEHARQRFGASPSAAQLSTALRELVGRIVEGSTGNVGVDVVLALDMDLAPPVAPPPAEMFAEPIVGGSAEGLSSNPPRPPTLLRTLIGALGLRGRLVTNCGHVEMMPADGEHLWIKEGSISFLNPHGLLLSAARKGVLLHAVVEVLQRIAAFDLPIAESEVAQYRLFEQFNIALEAATTRGSRGGGSDVRLIALVP